MELSFHKNDCKQLENLQGNIFARGCTYNIALCTATHCHVIHQEEGHKKTNHMAQLSELLTLISLRTNIKFNAPSTNTIARNANHWKIICWYDDQNPWYIVLLLVIHSLPPHLLQCNKILLTVWGPRKDWVALEPLHLQHLLWIINKHYNRKYYHTQSNHKGTHTSSLLSILQP